MKVSRPIIQLIIASLILLSILCITIFAIITSTSFLGFTTIEALSILSVAIIIEAPQSLGKSILLLFYEAIKALRNKNEATAMAMYPKISIIVPAHNEEEYIRDTLESLLEDTYPNKEIIVVDDGSTDKTYLKAKTLAKDPRVKVARRTMASGAKARAVNYGLIFARGDIIVVVDGDTVIERNSIKEIVAPMMKDPNVIGVAGNIKVYGKGKLLTRLQTYEYLLSMEIGRRWQGLLGGILVIPGAFGAIRREILESLGRMHDDTITEDFDMTLMLQKARKRVAFASKATAWTHVPERWKDWIRQRMRWSSGQAQVYIKHSGILLRKRFGMLGLVIAPNNVFMDMIALLTRYFWLAAIIVLYVASLSYLLRVLLLILSFYLILESLQLALALSITLEKEDLENIPLVPIIILYRSLHSIVRLLAYTSVLLGKKTRW